MKMKLLITAALFFFAMNTNAQLRVNKESVIRIGDTRISLEELMEKMKTKKYKLTAVQGKDNEFELTERKEGDAMIEGTGKPYYGSGEFYDQFYGKQAPDFSVTTIENRKLKLSELKGKTIVLNFWFRQCKPCVAEMPSLNKLVDKYKDNSSVVFLSIALDSPEEIRSFVEKTTFNYQHAGDAKKNDIHKDYGIFSYPTNIIIDKEGKVRYASHGAPAQPEEIEHAVSRMNEVIKEIL